jgi:hypothetical protein
MSAAPVNRESLDANVHEVLGRFFGAHNARSIRTKDLVESFVPSAPWHELIKPRNHLLIGPRGAGKTHLLKMLAPESLARWEHENASEARSIVDYPAALVLSDRHWHAQLIALTAGVEEEWASRVQSSALTIAVMKALISCVRQRAEGHHLPLSLDEDAYRALWRSVSDVWGLPPAGSLRMLSDHVSREAMSLHRAVTSLKPVGDSKALEGLAVYGRDAHMAAEAFVERVNDAAGESDRRWALLFDELELASAGLRRYIEQLLRGGSQLLLVKVSLAPYTADTGASVINTPMGGMAGHDFHTISLTYPDKESARNFTVDLMQRRLELAGLERSVDELLGPSDLDDGEGTEYQGLATYRALAKRDPSFAEYLKSKKIDLDDLEALSAADRAAWLRKPRGAISIREAYGFKLGGGRRSRRRPLPFTGTTAICGVLEGNARWIIGVTERLAEGAQTETGRLAGLQQAEIVQRAASSYHNFLAMLPNPLGEDAPAELLPATVADRIGAFFHSNTVAQRFRPEPPTTFRVPDDVSQDMKASLQTLLHSGALVHVPDSDAQIAVGSPAGLRFRLAYLLAPLYPFPLRVSKAVSLDRILTGVDADQMSMGMHEESQEGEQALAEAKNASEEEVAPTADAESSIEPAEATQVDPGPGAET